MIETDEKLIERCAEGDTGALEELMGRYRGPLMAFMVGMIRDYHRAQEAYQDTFIRVFRGARKFRAGKKFKTWLYTIAANRCRDELRSMKRKRAWSLDAPLTVEEEGATHRDLLEYPGPGPGDEAAAAEFREVLDRELRELSAAHREVVVLNRINGLTYREIAEVTGVPPGTVRSRLHYALEHLRRRLSRYLDEGDEETT